jgi:hypothetical protein
MGLKFSIYMKEFLNRILVLGCLVLATVLFYVCLFYQFPIPLVNLVLFVVALFVLFMGFGYIDKLNGYGRYSGHTSDNKDEHHQIEHHFGDSGSDDNDCGEGEDI